MRAGHPLTGTATPVAAVAADVGWSVRRLHARRRAETGLSPQELARPAGGGIMLGSARESAGDQWPLRPGTFGAYVVCDDPDALFARAVAAGATVGREPSGTDYGARECLLRDPEGNHWSFGTYRGEPRS